MSSEPELTDATKAEQELGRKMAQQNAAALERAVKMREEEDAAKDPLATDEAQAATAEAESRGFPVAKEPSNPNKRSKQ